jgi:hypothetical protein
MAYFYIYLIFQRISQNFYLSIYKKQVNIILTFHTDILYQTLLALFLLTVVNFACIIFDNNDYINNLMLVSLFIFFYKLNKENFKLDSNIINRLLLLS